MTKNNSKPVLMTLSVASALALSVLGSTLGAAQSSNSAPTATPIPISPDGPATHSPVVENLSPNSADLVTWLPNTVFLTLPANRQVSVTATSSIPFDRSFAKYVLYDGNGTPQGQQNVTPAYGNGDLTANISVIVPSGNYSKIVFQMKDTLNSTTVYEREYRLARLVYFPILYRDYEYPPTNIEVTEPNNSVCTAAGQLRSGKTYNASFTSPSDLDDWYYIDITAGSSIQVSATGLPTPNQLQVYVVPSIDCGSVSGAPTVKTDNLANSTITVSSATNGRVFIRAVGISNQTPSGSYTIKAEPNPTTGPFEDNDNPCQATKTIAGTRYTTNVDDAYDFFEIVVPQQGNVKLLIENYPVASQLQLRSPVVNSNCDPVASTTRLGNAAFIVSGRAEINALLNPGVYYARMGEPGQNQTTNLPYNFTWTFTPSTGTRSTDTCSAFSSCFGDSTGGKFTLYWRGMTANTQLQVSYTTEAHLTCPAATLPAGQTIDIGSTTTGNRELTGFGTGFIKVRVRALENGVEVYNSEHPIKMNCNFLSSAAAVEVPTPGPTPAP